MKLPVLSHTFLDNYENCPRKAWHYYVAKDLPKEPPSAEMQIGIDVHENFQKHLSAGTPNLAPNAEMGVMVHQAPGIKHYEWEAAITAAGTPCGFWTEMAWFRGKLDVAMVAPPLGFILDWKTGKRREDTTELERFSVLLQAHYPGVEEVAGAYVWLNHGGMGPTHTLTPTRALRKIKELDEGLKARPLDKEWNPTPNPLCGWCRVKTCEHWRERK